MANDIDLVDGPSASQRRRRFSSDHKLKILEEASLPGMTVSSVARLHDISPSLIFHWRRRFAKGGAETIAASIDMNNVSAKLHALEARVRELERMLGKMTLENEALRRALRVAVTNDLAAQLPPSWSDVDAT